MGQVVEAAEVERLGLEIRVGSGRDGLSQGAHHREQRGLAGAVLADEEGERRQTSLLPRAEAAEALDLDSGHAHRVSVRCARPDSLVVRSRSARTSGGSAGSLGGARPADGFAGRAFEAYGPPGPGPLKSRGRKSSSFVMLALLPVARITKKPLCLA